MNPQIFQLILIVLGIIISIMTYFVRKLVDKVEHLDKSINEMLIRITIVETEHKNRPCASS